MKVNLPLAAIFSLGLAIRLVNITNLPPGFTADEAGHGYTAYSIYKTGKDEWGQFLPLSPRAFGDFRAPLYTYLIVPSVIMFGLTEFAVRLPAAIFGSATIIAIYYLVIELLKHQKFFIGSYSIALVSALLLAINPWHIQLSRGGFESNLPLLLIVIGWIFLQRLKLNYSAFFFGISLFSYFSAKFFVPLFLPILLFINSSKIKEHLRNNYKIPGLIILFFIIINLIANSSGGARRSSDIAIYNPTDKWQAVSNYRYEAVLRGLPDSIARLFANKATFVVEQFFRNYLTYLSPHFLFIQGAGEAYYGIMPGNSLFNPLELIFIIFGLCLIVKNRLIFTYPVNALILWLIISPIPAAMAKGPGFAANRTAIMLLPLIIFSSIGLVRIYALLRASKINVVNIVLIFSIVALELGFAERYIYHTQNSLAGSMNYGWKEASEFIKKNESQYRQIIVSRKFSEPQIFIAFYLKIDPRLTQTSSIRWLNYEKQGLKFVDQLNNYTLGKFTFKTIEYFDDANMENTLIIAKPEEIPSSVPLLSQVNYPDGKTAFVMVKSLK